jgi:predicted nucleic acid-binding protein
MALISPSSSKCEEEEVNECYRFELLEHSHGLFDSLWDDSIEATYIIHLEGNGRLEKIKAQLETFQPTQKIYILHNKGYKKCNKTKEIDKQPLDLVDAFLELFRHAQERGYGNILVLEDDFQFDTRILLPEHRDEIAGFLTEHKNEDFLYKLGCLPYFMVPTDIHLKHYLITTSVGMHAVVYSQKLRDRVLNTEPSEIRDWDVYHNFHSRNYTYYTALCYQLFPQTENQKKWATDYWYMKPLVPLFIGCLKALKLDTQVEPGYSFFYGMSKMLFWWLVLLAVGLLVWLLRSLFRPFFRSLFLSWKKGGKRGV